MAVQRSMQRVRIWSWPVMLCGLLLTLSSVRAQTAITLPDIGDSTEVFLSSEDEQRLGESFMRNLRANLTIINDPQLHDYINDLGKRLASASDAGSRSFDFFIVDAPDINAFAGPGGHIGLHSALLLTAEDEDELAGVLAHEIAHVTQRHLARAYQEASRMNLPLTAAVIAAIILGKDNIQIAEAALAASAAGSAQHEINFTRSNEQEADRVGIQILLQSGYNPRGMPSFFERLQRASLMYNEQPNAFLRTHPVTHERIADTLNRASQAPATSHSDNFTFSLMQTRLRVLISHDLSSERNNLRSQLEKHAGNETAQRYGLALCELLLGNLEQAEQQTRALPARIRNNIHLQLLVAEIDRQRGNSERALALDNRLADQYPHYTSLAMHQAQLLVNLRQYNAAEQLLKRHLDRDDSQPLLYKTLAEAQNGLGAIAESHLSLAEYYYREGGTEIALQHLQIALKESRDNAVSARIKARIKVIRSETEPNKPAE
ncbi:MAG: M48 family metallopeptidase [Gammaproteobacteria bacterium]|nr:M48 family metallopeptidase [Gammaproteobacteria bacterium]